MTWGLTYFDEFTLHTYASHTLNQDLAKISSWADKWLVLFNPKKTKSILLSHKINKPVHPPLIIIIVAITIVESHKHLGYTFESSGSWHKNIQLITPKAWQRIHIMRKLKFNLDMKSLDIIYTSFIMPILEYADVVWCNLTKYQEGELEKYNLKLPG